MQIIKYEKLAIGIVSIIQYEGDFEEFKKQFSKVIYAMQTLINNDFKVLSDDILYDSLSELYAFFLSQKDVLSALSKKYNREYNRIEYVNTNMTFKDTVCEDYGKNFEWLEKEFGYSFWAALSSDAIIDPNHLYTKEELELMSEKGNIINLGGETTEAPYFEHENNTFTSIEKINMPNHELYNEVKKDDLFPFFMKIIRKRLPKERVIKDITQIIQEFERIFAYEIPNLEYASNNDPFNKHKLWLNAAYWFRTSGEKEKTTYLELIRTIKNSTIF